MGVLKEVNSQISIQKAIGLIKDYKKKYYINAEALRVFGRNRRRDRRPLLGQKF